MDNLFPNERETLRFGKKFWKIGLPGEKIRFNDAVAGIYIFQSLNSDVVIYDFAFPEGGGEIKVLTPRPFFICWNEILKPSTGVDKSADVRVSKRGREFPKK
jgi:hypothetical protein